MFSTFEVPKVRGQYLGFGGTGVDTTKMVPTTISAVANTGMYQYHFRTRTDPVGIIRLLRYSMVIHEKSTIFVQFFKFFLKIN